MQKKDISINEHLESISHIFDSTHNNYKVQLMNTPELNLVEINSLKNTLLEIVIFEHFKKHFHIWAFA